jgi:hypothetical protein
MVVRGVVFAGSDFDSLEAAGEPDFARLASFPLHRGSLCSCLIEADIPIPAAAPGGTDEGVLMARLELGNPAPSGGLDRERLSLELRLGGRAFASSGRSGWFEDEMLDVQGQLPPGTQIRPCINRG